MPRGIRLSLNPSNKNLSPRAKAYLAKLRAESAKRKGVKVPSQAAQQRAAMMEQQRLAQVANAKVATQVSPAQMARQVAENRAKQLGLNSKNPADYAAIQRSNQEVAKSMTPPQPRSGKGVVYTPKTATQTGGTPTPTPTQRQAQAQMEAGNVQAAQAQKVKAAMQQGNPVAGMAKGGVVKKTAKKVSKNTAKKVSKKTGKK